MYETAVGLDKQDLVGFTKVFGLYLKINRKQPKYFQEKK